MPLRATHHCQIVMKDLANLGEASLLVDGTDFRLLMPKQVPPAEENVTMTVNAGIEEVVRRTYGIVVPPRLSNTVTDSVSQAHAAGGAFVEQLAEKVPAMLSAM